VAGPDADAAGADEDARMIPVAQVLAALEALTLIAVGMLESFFFRSPELYPIFLIDPDEYDAVALWTRNVGVYNMLMGLAVVVGLVLVHRAQVAAGRAIILVICAMHVVLGVSLVITAPELWLSAVFEFGLALAVILAIVLGDRRATARTPSDAMTAA
jgi:putative membrane protein